MQKPVVVGPLMLSKVLLVGQAPGDKEPALGRPFAWTAGKQLFKWFAPLGIDEATFRERVYMAATCRCFPGKQPRGGDRVPSEQEVANCRPWLEREVALLEPELLLPVGRLAIEQFLPARPLVEQVGTVQRVTLAGRAIDVIALPHPSGASTWPRSEPGKSLTARAFRLIGEHPAWRALLGSAPDSEVRRHTEQQAVAIATSQQAHQRGERQVEPGPRRIRRSERDV
jgi:uracil-DNA glycosylase